MPHLNGNSHLQVHSTQGAYLWISSSQENDLADWFQTNHNTLVKPGSLFGSPENFIRLNLMAEPEIVQELANRLSKL